MAAAQIVLLLHDLPRLFDGNRRAASPWIGYANQRPIRTQLNGLRIALISGSLLHRVAAAAKGLLDRNRQARSLEREEHPEGAGDGVAERRSRS
jgi:hypothetical protein